MAITEPTYVTIKSTFPQSDVTVINNGLEALYDNDMELDARVTVCESASAPSAKQLYTRMMGGQHFDLAWKDADEVIIKPKHAQGLGAWVGVVLNDNEYIEATADITVKYDTPGNSGHILDGITAKLNNEWQILWLYKASGGTLEAGFTWMPNFTLDSESGDNVLTPHKINSQDACKLVPVDAHLVLFEDADEFETPLGYANAGAFSYDATRDKPKVASTTSTTITLAATLSKTDFAHGTYIYQVDGFKPLQISDGAIASAISTRGYRDTGMRLLTDASGNLRNFTIRGKQLIWANGSGADNYGYDTGIETITTGSTYSNFLLTCCPPDKSVIALGFTNVDYLYSKEYYNTYGSLILDAASQHIAVPLYENLICIHRIVSVKDAGGTATYFQVRGYMI